MTFNRFEECVMYLKSHHFKEVYLAGAGQYGEIVYNILKPNGISIAGFIDKKIVGYVNGLPVFNYESFDADADCFIVTSYIWRREIEDQLLDRGVPSDKILDFSNQDIFYEEMEKKIPYKKYVEKNIQFKHMYKGKRCFVIGNGPSLQISDLEKLKGEFTIACNSIIELYKMTTWRPTFYFCWDHDYCKYIMEKREDMRYLQENCSYVFTSLGAEGIKYRDDEEFRNLRFVKAMHKYEMEESGLPLFSMDSSTVVYGAGVAAYPMLQLAAYTGVSEIYLLGMDNLYANAKKNGKEIVRNVSNYSDEMEKGDKKYFTYLGEKPKIFVDEDMVEKGYISVRKNCERNNIKVYNATRGGALEIFERVDFDTLHFAADEKRSTN